MGAAFSMLTSFIFFFFMSTLPKIFDRKPCVVELEAGDHWWCACGLSGHQPMCDGSHKGSGLGPRKLTLAEKTKVWLCNCKHSNNPPFCDGSHSKLPEAVAE
jgi:CDGSH-type Zn-finger protein